jgi:hypothetical protein
VQANIVNGTWHIARVTIPYPPTRKFVCLKVKKAHAYPYSFAEGSPLKRSSPLVHSYSLRCLLTHCVNALGCPPLPLAMDILGALISAAPLSGTPCTQASLTPCVSFTRPFHYPAPIVGPYLGTMPGVGELFPKGGHRAD